ncbi:VOC family protein [Pseudactinotalea sp. HY158]|uniref:VOC family protein n=1 Tax=Pseudactinotalea sp. HY158 TaxID=2654547 RepID=UPI00129CC3E1|nr:VOC family protein [Pseudactinotalea sp. HY158]QGH70681.1 VOC family protein [Pseudactinotalea sp. HY158]
MTRTLAPDTSMGVVDLLVRDPDAMVAFYTAGVGLAVLGQAGPTVTLGRSRNPVVRLTRESDLPDFDRGDAGLFHTAVLYPTQADLAAAVLSTVRHAPAAFTGSADHLVSEAFYFDDPEGNGVELYTDRARSSWTYAADGSVRMATNLLDPNTYLQDHLDDAGMTGAQHAAASVGHVHLQVGDIDLARDFYAGVLGFEVTSRFGSQALFVAAGGYHHHIGLNSWNSRGAGPRAASLGLGQVAIEVPAGEEIERIAHRLGRNGVDHRTVDGSLQVRDPWATLIEIRPRGLEPARAGVAV